MRHVIVPNENCQIYQTLKPFFASENNLQSTIFAFWNSCSLRKQISTQEVDLVLDNTENNCKVIYDVVQFTAMKWMTQL